MINQNKCFWNQKKIMIIIMIKKKKRLRTALIKEKK